MDNYYQILGVPANATQEEIRRRYFFLAKAYHPDRFTDDASKAEAQREMQKINAAYDTLSNAEKRRRYDQSSGREEYQTASSNEETDNTERDLEESVAYLQRLVERWNVHVTLSPLNSQIKSQRINLIGNILDFLNNAYPRSQKIKIAEETQKAHRAVDTLIDCGIALGMQQKKGSFNEGFRLDELSYTATLPIGVLLYEAVEYYKKQNGGLSNSLSRDLDNIGNNIKSLLAYCQLNAESLLYPSYYSSPQQPHNKANNYTTSQDTHAYEGYCQSCHKDLPTKDVTFRYNIGLLVRRLKGRTSGNMCSYCVEKYFWEYTVITLFLGWWGIISFFNTPFNLLLNVYNYLKTLQLKPGKLSVLSVAWLAKVFILLGLMAFAWFYGDSVLNYFFPNWGIPNKTTIESQAPASASAPQRALLPTATKAATLTPTKVPIYYNDLECYKWDKISIDMSSIPDDICVYGIVEESYVLQDNTFVMIFDQNARIHNEGFRLINFNGEPIDDIVGKCVVTSGKVKIYDGIPYIEPGGLMNLSYDISRCN